MNKARYAAVKELKPSRSVLLIVEDAFDYLDNLRETGAINMFESPGYVAVEFGISTAVAREVVTVWMDTYHLKEEE
jgi:hypothetical protein